MDDTKPTPVKTFAVEEVCSWLLRLGRHGIMRIFSVLLSLLADDDYFDTMPAGYRFNPTEVELVSEYLMKKINGQKVPRSRIHVVNLIHSDPEQLAATHTPCEENEWYFFTPRYKKYKGGQRPNRAAGKGYWKATGADKSIKHNDVVIGYRKALVYYTGRPRFSSKTDWIMHEYKVYNSTVSNRSASDTMVLDDWVLCKIYKKASKSQRQEEPEVQNTQEGNTDMDETMEEEIPSTPEVDTMNALVEADDEVMSMYSQPLNDSAGPSAIELPPIPDSFPSGHDNQIPMPPASSLKSDDQAGLTGAYESNTTSSSFVLEPLWTDLEPPVQVCEANMKLEWDRNSCLVYQSSQLENATVDSIIELPEFPPDRSTLHQTFNESAQEANPNPLEQHYLGDTVKRVPISSSLEENFVTFV